MMKANNAALRLHLGCGQTYLKGYLNIDYPSSEHTIQVQTVADRLEDITKLRFERDSVDEVRLHHVFEHFRRPQITAMVACWNSWLKEGGRLHIEVPDIGRIARVLANPFTGTKRRAVAERHLFGSHEASWAAHYEGYDEKLLCQMLQVLGFKVDKVRRSSWKGTYNIHVYAAKTLDLISVDQAAGSGRAYLSRFLVDDTPGELELLEVWMRAFEDQLQHGWAKD